MSSLANTWCVLLALLPGFAGAASLTALLTDQGGAPVLDAVVYLLPEGGKAALPTPASTSIDQIDRQFSPMVSVISTGTSVSFPNKDNIRHQVYSFSPAKSFVLKLYSGVPAQPVVFDKPGLVVLGCNIHDKMVAYVQVVDTPWYAKTGADGLARVSGLPAGDYEMHIWHYRQLGDDVVRHNVHLNAEAKLAIVLDLKSATQMDMPP